MAQLDYWVCLLSKASGQVPYCRLWLLTPFRPSCWSLEGKRFWQRYPLLTCGPSYWKPYTFFLTDYDFEMINFGRQSEVSVINMLINKGQNYWALIGWERGHFFLIVFLKTLVQLILNSTWPHVITYTNYACVNPNLKWKMVKYISISVTFTNLNFWSQIIYEKNVESTDPFLSLLLHGITLWYE